MKLFLKIIMFIPFVNFLSFFLLAIPFVIIYKFSWMDHFKNFMLMAVGFFTTGGIRIWSAELTGIISQIIYWGSFYILGIYITMVALRSIPKRQAKGK